MKRVMLILNIIFGLMLFGGGFACTIGVLPAAVPIIGVVGIIVTNIIWFIAKSISTAKSIVGGVMDMKYSSENRKTED